MKPKMKPLLIAFLLFLFASTTVSYAGFFKNGQADTNTSHDNSSNNTNYQTTLNYSEGVEATDNGGIFSASNPTDDPGGRPGNGDGIGQQKAPIGRGTHTLLVCCLIYGIVKFSIDRRQRLK